MHKDDEQIPEGGAVELREISRFEDINSCVELQRTTWGMDDVDLTPARLFVLARYGGTPPLGAFDQGGRLLGFLHTLLARIDGTPAYYSHMLAVAPDARDRGVGRALKLAQRDRALADGIGLIVWTFDPLQSRNAHFNINRLGVVARKYIENFYGEHHSTVFDAGLGSDRLFAEWWVASPRVVQTLAGNHHQGAVSATVEIPGDINSIKMTAPAEALAWRTSVRQGFQDFLASGRYVHGFVFDSASGKGRYLLADEPELANEIG